VGQRLPHSSNTLKFVYATLSKGTGLKKRPPLVTALEKRATNTARSAAKKIPSYKGLLKEGVALIESGLTTASRVVNQAITTRYWLMGKRIVEQEQKGAHRAEYGEAILRGLAEELTRRSHRGFSKRNLEQMRLFYLMYPIAQTVSAQFEDEQDWPVLPLPWSHYVRLLSVSNTEARAYYEEEAIRGGWSVRQLDRQISTLAYQRLKGKSKRLPGEKASADEMIRDPFMLEFLGLKDEYSEGELEELLILELQQFLLELGNGFTFVGRQQRLRIGNESYRIDLRFFHRGLRCLVIVDLKVDKFTHADTGQMHMYLNYAKEHWTLEGENPPVGLILCSEKDTAVAKYALDNLTSKVMAREYQLVLPKPGDLQKRLEKAQRRAARKAIV
jgi:predicted nuclease of restriction endonuclease-like (RecB) superfamily